jgi:hypothetical protein|tara:strand:+ start:1632 stop:2741 length:1110 start_codon:yes stop_codon:yes gene_type:complete
MIENVHYNNKKYKILTPEGYKDFLGVSYNGKKELWKITLENDMFIEASEEHKFLINGNYRKLKDIHLGCFLETVKGESKVVSVENTKELEDTYDILHVDNTTNTFFGNGIETSNCKFLGSAATLVDPDLLERLGMAAEDPKHIKYNGAMKIFEKPIPGEFYIAGVDSAAGNGGDSSVIQVLKVTGEQEFEQVAVFESNMVSYAKFAEITIGISEYYNRCYLMVENNDIGGQVANMIWHDYEYDLIINTDKKRIGTRATKTTKLAANMLLKRYVENGWLKLKDEDTLRQLSMYEEVNPNVYKAPQSEHDDHVTSLLWAMYYVTTPYFDFQGNERKKINNKYDISKQEESYSDMLPVFDAEDEVDELGFKW